MALDTKQKRGSAIDLTLGFRSWLAEPDGSLAVTDRLSLLKLASAVSPAGGILVNVHRFALRARVRDWDVEARG
jgi:hypothetical protein